MAAETKTSPSQTTGEECPSPGVAVFQSPFTSGSKRTGRPVSAETPFAAGPRQAGQFEDSFTGNGRVSAADELEAGCAPETNGSARSAVPATRAAPDTWKRGDLRTVASYSVACCDICLATPAPGRSRSG